MRANVCMYVDSEVENVWMDGDSELAYVCMYGWGCSARECMYVWMWTASWRMYVCMDVDSVLATLRATLVADGYVCVCVYMRMSMGSVRRVSRFHIIVRLFCKRAL